MKRWQKLLLICVPPLLIAATPLCSTRVQMALKEMLSDDGQFITLELENDQSPTDDQVLTWQTGNTVTWEDAGAGSGDFDNNGDTAGADRTIGNNDTYDLGIETDGTTRIHIESGGNVGINDTTPLRQLDVNGSTRVTTTAGFELTGDIDTDGTTTVIGVGTAFLTELIPGDRIEIDSDLEELRTVTAIASDTSLTILEAFSNQSNDTTPYAYPAALIAIDGSADVALVVKSNGNVGVQANKAESPLTIGGNVSIREEGDVRADAGTTDASITVWSNDVDAGGSDYASLFHNQADVIFDWGAGNFLFTNPSNSYIGMGTASPTTVLHIDSETVDDTGILTLENDDGDIVWRLGTATPQSDITGSIGDLFIDTTGTGTMYIKETGTGTNTGWSVVGSTAAGAFSDAGDPIVQNDNTKDLQVGAAHINSAKVAIDGDADQVQLGIQSHSTQNENVIEVENSAATNIFTVDNTGLIGAAGLDTNVADGGHRIGASNSTGFTGSSESDGDINYDAAQGRWEMKENGGWSTFLTSSQDTRSKSFVIETPVNTDRFIFWRTDKAITITAINGIIDPGDSGESVVFALYESDGSGDFTDLTTNGIDGIQDIEADNNGTNDDGSLSNGGVAANVWVGIDVGTVIGTVSAMTITYYYTID